VVVSVIFPTYNRARILEEAIASLVRQIAEEEANVEIIVVDNNSIDDTFKVVDALSKKLSSIAVRYCREQRQGLSFARNRGILESHGDLIVFADDDIEFADGWLRRCVQLFVENPDVDILGGPVLPYASTLPSWLPDKFSFLVGVWNHRGVLGRVNHLIGCNFCVRREVVDSVGGFDVNLGRKGELLLMGEENDFFSRARKRGFSIFADEGMIVYHKIAAKLNMDYIIQNAISSGAGLARYDRQDASWPRRVAKRGYYLVKYLYLASASRLVAGNNNIALTISKQHAVGYLRGVRIKENRIE
jgi:glycosyltransferase involved in cell wall biosynthesis